MNKKYIVIFVAALFLSSTTGVFAANDWNSTRSNKTSKTTGVDGNNPDDNFQDFLNKNRHQVKDVYKAERDIMKRNVQKARAFKKEKIGEMRDFRKTKKQEMKTGAQKMRQDFKVKMKNADTVEARKAIRANAVGARKAMKEKRVELKQGFKAKRAQLRGELKKAIKARISAHVQRVMKRLTAAVGRFEKLQTRIASRIEKLQADGKDMARAKDLLEKTKSKIAEARNNVRLANAVLTEVATAEKPKEYAPRARTALKKAVASIKEVRQLMKQVIQEIKK